MHEIQFKVYEVLTGKPLGTLDPESYSFNDPVWGTGAFTATLAIPRVGGIDSLKNKTNPDLVQLYVLMDGLVLWGGIINSRPRTPGTQTITIKAQHWKAWYYSRVFTQRVIFDEDEFSIIYKLMQFATEEPGTPDLKMGTNLAGRTRQLTVEPGWSVGKALDSMGQRDDGYEWSIGLRYSGQTGLPEQYLEIWEPGQPRANATLLSLDQSQGTNRITVGEISDDATERRSRVWAASEGTWPDVITVEDHHPELANGTVLLREEYITPSGVLLAPTLYDHARAERVSRSAPISVIPVDHPYTTPSIVSYRSGDRARLRLKDDWEDSDRKGVRIIDRAINKAKDGLPIATVQLNLLDVRDVSSTVTQGG